MSRKISIILVFAVLAAFLGYAGWKVLLEPSDLPPDGFARGNGRIEADLVDISTRLAGRVSEITVREGDLVQPGDVLAVMDTTELEAQKMRAEAAVASAEAAVAVAQAGVTEAEARLALSQSELTRAETLNERGVVSGEELDIRRTERNWPRQAAPPHRQASWPSNELLTPKPLPCVKSRRALPTARFMRLRRGVFSIVLRSRAKFWAGVARC